MAYPLKIVIFHGYISHNQMVTGKMVDFNGDAMGKWAWGIWRDASGYITAYL